MSASGDPYEGGTPKYQSVYEIYDALKEMEHVEERNILADIGADVSYEDQGYCYYDKGHALRERFDEMTESGEKMWPLELAAFQIDGGEAADIVYGALTDGELAKRTGFRRIFAEQVLRGSAERYGEIAGEFASAMGEMDRFWHIDVCWALHDILERHGLGTKGVFTYPILASAVAEKVRGLRLYEETRLVTESRALLTSYDDFILGLRMNQALYEQQERR
jgi:hypothetical protein